MKIFIMLVMTAICVSSYAQSTITLSEYYEQYNVSRTDYLNAVSESEEFISYLESKKHKSGEDFFLLYRIGSDKLTFEGRRVIFVEKTVTKNEFFNSKKFVDSYVSFGTYLKAAISQSRAGIAPITYKEISQIISNPFLSAEVKELAQKYSLEILKDEDLGSPEHPLTREKYIGRIFKMMVVDYCAEGRCEETKRLVGEMKALAPDDTQLAQLGQQLLYEFYAPNTAIAEDGPQEQTPHVTDTSVQPEPVKEPEPKQVVQTPVATPEPVKPAAPLVAPATAESSDNYLLVTISFVLLGLIGLGIAFGRKKN